MNDNFKYDKNGRIIIQSRALSKNQNIFSDGNDSCADESSEKNLQNEKTQIIKESDNNLLSKKNSKTKKKKSKKKKKKSITKESVMFSKSQVPSKNKKKMDFHPNRKINKIIVKRFLKFNMKFGFKNETEFTDFFMCLYDKFIVYNYDTKMWLYWTGKYWRSDDDRMIYKFVSNAIDEFNKRLCEYNSNTSEIKSNYSYGNHRSIENIIIMASTRCIYHTEDFNKYTYFLNVKNGIIDLRTKELLAHDPKYMITQFVNVKYDSNAIGERFTNFITEICNNDECLADYLQTLYGYSVTGEINEQCCFIESGTGANGKSTLNNVISTILEDYTDIVSFDLFKKNTYSSANAPTPELAKLVNKRIVFCAETDNLEINEAKLKEITGGTKITARKAYGNPFSYMPQYTIIFESNNKPTIKGTDYGIWRRIKVIPFQCTFKKDVALKDALLKEKKVILKWLVDGAYNYYKAGFPACKAVKKATNQYCENEDTVGVFVKYAVKREDDGKCPARILYDAYEKYCKNCGMPSVSIKEFKYAMESKGFTQKRNNQGVFWLGICLNESN